MARALLVAGCLAGAGLIILTGVLRQRETDPLASARAAPLVAANREAPVPPMCYTATDGTSNPCFVCHTIGQRLNLRTDLQLQAEYSFSETALTNHWTNLFIDRSSAVAAQSDREIQQWIREDNYSALKRRMAGAPAEYEGYRPDLDFEQGFDEEGFAKDGSGWRALRYLPFPGTFWPTNGSLGDVYVRLPAPFRESAPGEPSREVAKANLSLLEAALASDPRLKDDAVERIIEPLNERALGVDLDGDDALLVAKTLRGLPTHFLGAASRIPVTRGLYPVGVEFLHPVRYLNPDAPSFAATRLKELRYSYKAMFLDLSMLHAWQEEETERKDRGALPRIRGTPMKGYLTEAGWVLQGFIEDGDGELRLQTHEEHTACLGCHTGIGVTQDGTFSFVRKVPGAGGWQPQNLRGLADVPQVGHTEPEALTYFRRVRAADEFRANTEMLERFFTPQGDVDEAKVRTAKDLAELVFPSRRRALDLDKAYRALVREQRFDLGRDAPLSPPRFVHRVIENGDTALGQAGRLYADGTLFLDWTKTSLERKEDSRTAGVGQP
jgi:hypothetical protein